VFWFFTEQALQRHLNRLPEPPMIRENLKKEIKMFVEMLHQRAREEGRCVVIIVIYVFFTIMAEILLLSLANFHCQWVERRKDCNYAMRQQSRADNLTIGNRKKQIDVIFSCLCPFTGNELCHNMVKIDNGIKKFVINKRTGAWKTEVNWFDKLIAWSCHYVLSQL